MTSMQTDNIGVIIACPACGQKNRTPYERLGETGHCGRCKITLPTPSQPIEIGQTAHFDALLRQSSLPFVVDFWASWCAPCRMVAPELVKVAAENAGHFLVVKINTEALPELASRYAVQSIPLMAVFRNGREIARTAGARPAAAIQEFVLQAIRTPA